MEKLATLLAIALLLVPAVLAAHPAPVVTGHTRFVDLDGYDPCLAGIAGLARMRVLWFNDVPLYERSSVGEGKYLYAVQNGAPDPRDEQIVTSGERFEFKDPNGNWWEIVEGYFDVDPRAGGEFSVSGSGVTFPKNATVSLARMYVWIVQINPGEPFPNDNFGDHPEAAFYNFVTLVDTCKFTSAITSTGNASHDTAADGGVDHESYDGEHEPGYTSHEHETWLVDLWIGGAANLVDLNYDPNPDGAWVRLEGGGSAGTTRGTD